MFAIPDSVALEVVPPRRKTVWMRHDPSLGLQRHDPARLGRADPSRPHRRVRLNGVEAATRYFSACLDHLPTDDESLWVAQMDADGHVVALRHHAGAPAHVDLPLRDILGDALRHQAAGMMIMHHHPSGDCSPSIADCRATRRLAEAAAALDVVLVDHLIAAPSGAGWQWRSFRQMGLL